MKKQSSQNEEKEEFSSSSTAFLSTISQSSNSLRNSPVIKSSNSKDDKPIDDAVANGWLHYDKKNYTEALVCFQQTKNLAESNRFYTLMITATNQKDASAQNALGIMYENGQGVTRDYQQAFNYFNLAAEQRYANAQYQLGLMYYKGQGVTRDYQQAFNYFSLAAEQRYADAQYTVGLMYAKGEGVLKDEAKAVEYIQQAAKQKHIEALFNMGGRHHKTGQRVPEDYQQAFHHFSLAANQGHAGSQFNLGFMYEKGQGVPKDEAMAVKCYQRAADQGDVNAQYSLGFIYENGKGVPKDEAMAVKYYQRAADQGFADAQCALGFMYENGKGVPKDMVKAFEFCQQAAKQGLARAQCSLGLMHYKGNGVTQDYQQAFNCFSLVAEQEGNVSGQHNLKLMYKISAQYHLGLMYKNGHGVTQDYQQALNYLNLAAEQRNVDAWTMLGFMYGQGQGVSQDKAKAIEYYQKAAEEGDVSAQYNLGLMYKNGQGVTQNYQQAFSYFSLAAKQRHAGSQFNLSLMYSNGQGVPKDAAMAVKCCQQAAEQGYVSAQYNLGVYYENGQGVSEDKATAVEYYQKAAEQGYVNARLNLGLMYYKGHGVTQDYQQAFNYFSLAAEQGQPTAQYQLGIMYKNGQGVGQDWQEAFNYFSLAAKQGYAGAQILVESMHKQGYRTVKNGIPASINDSLASVMWPLTHCTITQLVMADPVSTLSGNTYEREAIEDWFKGHNTDPKFGTVLHDKRLIPSQQTVSTRDAWFSQAPSNWHDPELIYLPKAWQKGMVEEIKGCNYAKMNRHLSQHPGLLTLRYSEYNQENTLQLICRYGHSEVLAWLQIRWETYKAGYTQSLLEEIYDGLGIYAWASANKAHTAVLLTLFGFDKRRVGKETLLHYALRTNEAGLVNQLIEYGPEEKNGANEKQETPLMLTAKVGNKAVVAVLLKHKAKLEEQNAAGETAIMLALTGGHYEIADMLLDAGAEFGPWLESQPLQHSKGWYSDVKVYLPQKWQKAVVETIKTNDRNMLDFYLSAHPGLLLHPYPEEGNKPLLFLIIQYGTAESLHIAIKHWEKHEEGSSAKLFLCAQYQGVKVNDWIIQNRYDVEFLNIFQRTTSKDKNETVLHVAARSDDPRLIEYWLSEGGGNKDQKNENGHTALMISVEHNNLHITLLLLKYKVDKEQRTETGETALYIAIKKKNMAIAAQLLNEGANPAIYSRETSQWLLETAILGEAPANLIEPILRQGANPKARNEQGQTVIESLQSKGHQELSHKLRQHMEQHKGSLQRQMWEMQQAQLELQTENHQMRLEMKIRLEAQQGVIAEQAKTIEKQEEKIYQLMRDLNKTMLDRLERLRHAVIEDFRTVEAEVSLKEIKRPTLPFELSRLPTLSIREVSQKLIQFPQVETLICSQSKASYEVKQTLRGYDIEVIYCLINLPGGQLASGARCIVYECSDVEEDEYVEVDEYPGIIDIWDAGSGTCLKTLKEHTDDVYSLCLLPTGELVSGARDRTIKVWNLDTGTCLETLEEHTDSVCSLVTLPGGQLASGAGDDTIKIWDTANWTCLRTLEGHTNSVQSLICLPAGQLASSSDDKTIKIWDTASGVCLRTLEGHTNGVESLALLPTGELASGSEDNTIKIWDITTGTCLRTLEGHTGAVHGLSILPTGKLASGAEDNTVKIWNTASGVCLRTLEGHTANVRGLTTLPEGQLVSGSCDTIKIWETTKELREEEPLVFREELRKAARIIRQETSLTLSVKEALSDGVITPERGNTLLQQMVEFTDRVLWSCEETENEYEQYDLQQEKGQITYKFIRKEQGDRLEELLRGLLVRPTELKLRADRLEKEQSLGKIPCFFKAEKRKRNETEEEIYFYEPLPKMRRKM